MNEILPYLAMVPLTAFAITLIHAYWSKLKWAIITTSFFAAVGFSFWAFIWGAMQVLS